MATFEDNGVLVNCPECEGSGHVDDDTCDKCDGMGDIRQARPWRVEFTIGTAERVESELDFDIFESEDIQRLFQPDETELIVDILWECVSKQANLRDVEPEEFAERLGGNAILDAHSALVESLEGFFMARGAAALASAIGRMSKMMTRANEKASEAIADLDLTDAEIDAQIEKAVKDAKEEKEKVLHGDESGK